VAAADPGEIVDDLVLLDGELAAFLGAGAEGGVAGGVEGGEGAGGEIGDAELAAPVEAEAF